MATEEVQKVYCCDRANDNSAMWAALMANRDKGVSPETLMAMNGGGGFGGNAWNNPLAK